MAKQNGIASGIRVVEVGASASVAMAGMVLADAGAEVILLEPPGGNPLRAEPAFRMWGRGKQSLVVDLASDEGKERALHLLRGADVVLLGLKPASAERLGLTPDALTAAAPRLIVGAVTGFGWHGPFRDVPTYDAVMQARGGRMYEFSTLFDGERPAFSAAPVVAHGAAMALLQGVFGALRERERNGGKGQTFETSLAHAIGVYDLLHWAPGGPMPRRFEDSPFLPYSVARTADGVWLQFAQNGPALFADFMRAIGLEGQADYGNAMAPSDPAEKQALRQRIQSQIAQHTWAEWQQRFADERNLSAEQFWPAGEALDHPQFAAMGDVVEVADPEVGSTRQLGPLFEVPSRPLQPQGPAPALDSASGERFEVRAPETSAPAADPPGPGLLAGVTVLELGMWIALPFGGSQRAELGARVIKVEPLEGDPMRGSGPIGFKTVQGKESIALDLKAPGARDIVHRLVERADVVIHSYRPGVPERLGIDFDTLSQINPRLVYLYNGSYGSRGPRANAPAFHVTGGAVAGGAHLQAGAGCPPGPDATLSPEEMARISRRLELSNEANPDFNSAVAAAAAVTMGLYAQEQTGEAIAIETRMMLSNAMMMSQAFIDYSNRPERPELDRELTGFGPLYRLYPAAEGWVFVAAPTPRDFERLCAGLECAELTRDERFASPEARERHADALAEAIGSAIAKVSADELEAKLTDRGVACVRADQGPYRTWIFEQDWAREQGIVVEAADSMIGPYTRYGPPLSSARPAEPRGVFPSGQDTRALLAEIGLDPEEVAALFTSGTVTEPDASD